jgi:hypothetical protein
MRRERDTHTDRQTERYRKIEVTNEWFGRWYVSISIYNRVLLMQVSNINAIFYYQIMKIIFLEDILEISRIF